MTSMTLPPVPPRCPVAAPCLLAVESTLGSFLAVKKHINHLTDAQLDQVSYRLLGTFH